ncbi:MAG: ParA family protein [Acidobacteriota bacterium]|nr:ParA family protein [Acidobacteriota bacterium]
MIKLTFFYTKGGTGKTTLCFNYGWYQAEKRAKRVLFLDFDPQMNLIKSFADIPDKAYEMTLEDLIVRRLKKEPVTLSPYLIRVHPNIDILPCSNNFSQVEEYLTDYIIERVNRETRKLQSRYRNLFLKQLLDEIILESHYDYVLIDSQPNYSLLSTTALLYTGRLALIVRPELYSLLDINYLFKIVDLLKERFQAEIKVVGALINGFEPAKTLSRKIAGEYEARIMSRAPVLRQRIRLSSHVPNSITMERRPVFMTHPDSLVAQDMLAAFAELDGLIQADGPVPTLP